MKAKPHLSSSFQADSSIGKTRLLQTSGLTSLVVLLPLACAVAFETYHDPKLNDQGYCAQCHPGFSGGRSDTLHELHTGGIDPVTGNCDLCHTGNTRNNPLIMWSSLDSGTGLGCMGCHGHDYGETIRADYTNGTALFSLTGLHKNSGYGLRRHHARKGIGLCATCHTNDVNMAPYPENVINSGLGFTTHYYARTDVSLGDQPAHPITNEDTANDADSVGSDNDGDFVYDANDPDSSTNNPVRLSILLTATNTVFTWPYTNDGWRLQVQSVLSVSNTWTDVPQAPREPATNSQVWRVLLNNTQRMEFYRLNKTLY